MTLLRILGWLLIVLSAVLALGGPLATLAAQVLCPDGTCALATRGEAAWALIPLALPILPLGIGFLRYAATPRRRRG